MADRNSSGRHHVILVPGFAGFDALGQLEYYGGVTQVFEKFRKAAVLHYFDNFPTAAVVTRAARLRSYLAKRMARGEITPQDTISLVGHSTGGLDIRWLLWNWPARQANIPVDAGVSVKAGLLRDCLRRVVFLSVPHWGTNIADWVRAQALIREAVIAEMRAAVAGSQVFLLDWIETVLTGGAAHLTGAGIFRAIQDALSEANEYNGARTAERKADAHEAAAELALYLRHMASDFRAIDDLCSYSPRSINETPLSPAHFTIADRKQEQANLRNIEFRSYVTLGRRPFRFEPGGPAPAWELANPLTYPLMTPRAPGYDRTDIAYLKGYRACAGGPFTAPELSAEITRQLSGAPRGPIEIWDNDGIVNTLSMLWPKGENVLVSADHMDIVGHYRAIPAEPGSGRKYRIYDLLKSESGFGEDLFNQVWTDVFTFCVGGAGLLAAKARAGR